MKKLYIVAIILMISSLAGCNGTRPVELISLDNFVGDWHMTGAIDIDIDGRVYEQPIDRVVYIRDGYIEDSYGYPYIASFTEGNLWLTREEGVAGDDPYCGPFEGGLSMTYLFEGISPLFDTFYEGSAAGSTAVFTQRCQYKYVDLTSVVTLRRVN